MENNDFQVSSASSRGGQRRLTEAEINELKSYAVDGVISFWDYVEALTRMLNRETQKAQKIGHPDQYNAGKSASACRFA